MLFNLIPWAINALNRQWKLNPAIPVVALLTVLSRSMIEPLQNVNHPSIVHLDVISDSARELVPLIRLQVVVEAFALLLLIGFLAKFEIVQLLVSGVSILVGLNVLHVVSLMPMSSVMLPGSSCLVLLMFVVALKRPRTSLVLFSLAL